MFKVRVTPGATTWEVYFTKDTGRVIVKGLKDETEARTCAATLTAQKMYDGSTPIDASAL